MKRDKGTVLLSPQKMNNEDKRTVPLSPKLSVELEMERQYQEHMAVREFVTDCFSTPKNAEITLSILFVVLEVAAKLTAPYPPVSTAFFYAGMAVELISIGLAACWEE